MANDVYANGREISCKAADGKTIACFPDVAFTPPQTPATPPGVPIPYPNTGMAKDTNGGSKSVKISKKEVMLKNKSYFKTSTGDEAGSAPKKGVVTSKIKGKVYFNSWSMDVKFEGQNVVRHMDMTTHNHSSFPGNTPPWMYADTMAMSPIKDCEKDAATKKKACEGLETKADQCDNDKCKSAKRCELVTYKQGKRKGKKSQVACCPGDQPHHLVEAHCFYEVGERGNESKRVFKAPAGKRKYIDKDAPCVCAEGPRHAYEHGQFHAFQGALEKAFDKKSGDHTWTYSNARDTGAAAHKAVNPQCDEKCAKAQLDAYHKDRCGVKDDTPLRTDPVIRSEGKLSKTQKKKLKNAINKLAG